MPKNRRRIWFAAWILFPGSILLGSHFWLPSTDNALAQVPVPLKLESAQGMIRLPGGVFMMGSSQVSERDAQPLHRVRLGPFWLDAAPVTNRQFQRFVEQTQHETDAERLGSSQVFDRKTGTWNEVAGTNWRHPETPDSSLVGRENHPVVHVTWRDAVAYAAWAHKRLPTEAEWEFAARGGLSDCIFPWGRELNPDGRHLANGWQGHYPQQDLGHDGYRGTSPVKQFPPNRFGLHDMAGNVWNWCSDWYAADHYGASLPANPRGPASGDERVRRGGSWLSAPNYGDALRVAFRGYALPTKSTNHTGFRCARDAKAP